MRTLYEAASTVEAYMVRDLLRQQGLTAHVQGEHLQGGVGELPAGNLVRLLIDDADYELGRAAIARWEAEQPREPLRAPARAPASLGWLAIGVVAGIVLCRCSAHMAGALA